MHVERVEIYSDTTNAAILRHPGRRFPGVQIQGDTLHSLCWSADRALETLPPASAAYGELNSLRNRLWALLAHYKITMEENGIPLPFQDI